MDESGWYKADTSDFIPFKYSCILQINYFIGEKIFADVGKRKGHQEQGQKVSNPILNLL